MDIVEHILAGVDYTQTPNVSGEIKPKYILLHGTDETIEDLILDFTETTVVKESTHLIVDSVGNITQLAPFNAKTWHAGVSYWQGHHGLNGFAIGIYVQRKNGRYTDESLDALHDLIPSIVSHYNIRDVMSHHMVSPRKHCIPVPVNPFKPYVDYGNADSAGRFVATAAVEARGGPNVNFESLDTINAGEAVKVLRYSTDGEWAFVLYERDDHVVRQGWTHESSLRRL